LSKKQTLQPQHTKFLIPKTEKQKEYIRLIRTKTIIFALGQAGTGKTRVACSIALEELMNGKISKLILTRPVLESGESLGFLPGDLSEKINPYMLPIFNEFQESIDVKQLKLFLENKTIEIIPLAFMRGHTMKNCIVIADEMQNATYAQLKNLLTRVGDQGRLIINGDPAQSDLPYHSQGALDDIIDALCFTGDSIDEIGLVEFSREDIVRHALIGKILDKLEHIEKEDQQAPQGYVKRSKK